MFEQEYDDHREPHTEITLSNAMLLLIFFGLLVVCGVCFGFGYSVGKKRSVTTLAPPPAGSIAAAEQDTPARKTAHASASSATATAPVAKMPAVAPKTSSSPTPATKPAPNAAPVEADATPSTPTPPAHGYIVQVAAIAQQADALALASALRSKGFAADSKQGADHMFHVQLGPYAAQKDAASQRDKLVDDGYMAVIRQQ